MNRLRAEEAAQAAQAESAADQAPGAAGGGGETAGSQAARPIVLPLCFGRCREGLVVRDLEGWVTSANVPAFLTAWDQRRLVSDYAQSQATGYENARREVELERLDQQRKHDAASSPR